MNNKGFTLIELVVAIAILGVIMIMAVPAVNYIQRDNKDTKYRTYDKAINSAAKAYVDAYNEDLFGIDNTGCAVISYNDLKEKDLIEDIQVRNTDCGEEDTFVYVRKNKNENYHYSTNVTCRSGSKIIYGNGKKADEVEPCGLEDNMGPTIEISKNPNKNPYHIGDKLEVKIILTDQGVGLKANQVLTYQWFKGTEAFTDPKTLEFKNQNYDGSITRDVVVPNDLENIDEPVTYYLKVTGEIYDIDNNNTPVNLSESFNYFVGALLIRMKANGASMINPHHADYKIDSSDYIYHGTDDRVISKIKYKSEADLWNYNNPDWINIGRSHYHMESGKEWAYSGKEYNQATKYKVSNFGYNDSDLITKNITIDVIANWKINAYKLTYDNNGGSGCTSKTANYGSTWGNLCTPLRSGYEFLGWKDGTTTVTSSTTVTGNRTVKASWKQLFLKPSTPTITNPSGGKWTKNNFSLTLKTTTAASSIGKWYYTYNKSTLTQFNNSAGKAAVGVNNFTTYPFSAERGQYVYVKVCSTFATSATDNDNCSDYASTMIRIDKSPPYYVSKRKKNTSDRNYWYMTWKDDGCGLSTVNTGDKSRVYYCYGGASDTGCTRRCSKSQHNYNDDYRGTLEGIKDIWLRQAVIKDNFASGENDGELEFKTYRDCKNGRYVVKSESKICDKLDNCTKKYVSWDFR